MTKDLERKIYAARVVCSNCGKYSGLRIPLGMLVSEQPCPECGCNSVSRVKDNAPHSY